MFKNRWIKPAGCNLPPVVGASIRVNVCGVVDHVAPPAKFLESGRACFTDICQVDLATDHLGQYIDCEIVILAMQLDDPFGLGTPVAFTRVWENPQGLSPFYVLITGFPFSGAPLFVVTACHRFSFLTYQVLLVAISRILTNPCRSKVFTE